MKIYLVVLSLFIMSASAGSYVSAQDSQPRKEGAKVEGRAGDTNFDVRIQGDNENKAVFHNLGKVNGGHRVRKGLPARPALKDPLGLLGQLVADS